LARSAAACYDGFFAACRADAGHCFSIGVSRLAQALKPLAPRASAVGPVVLVMDDQTARQRHGFNPNADRAEMYPRLIRHERR
jgi:hypothetical protein